MEEMKDILLPISDMGYEIKTELNKTKDPYEIYVRIVTYLNPTLEWDEEIESELIRLNEFSSDNGFKISKVNYVLEEGYSGVTMANFDVFLDTMNNKENKGMTNLLLVLEQISR